MLAAPDRLADNTSNIHVAITMRPVTAPTTRIMLGRMNLARTVRSVKKLLQYLHLLIIFSYAECEHQLQSTNTVSRQHPLPATHLANFNCPFVSCWIVRLLFEPDMYSFCCWSILHYSSKNTRSTTTTRDFLRLSPRLFYTQGVGQRPS